LIFLENYPISPELILVGTYLPVMSGFEFIEEIKVNKKIYDRTFLYSPNSSEMISQKENYNVPVIEKPLTRDKLLNAISRLGIF
jgi:two-component SAPR family response regulator